MYLKTNRKRFRSPEERVGTLSNAGLPPPAAPVADPEEQLWVQALRNRDETAFERLVESYHSPMLRLATGYVRSREEAEEVMQDTWLAVLSGLDRFEGRSSLRTWITRILVNRARSRARRESRMVPFSALGPIEPGRNAGEIVQQLDWLRLASPEPAAAWAMGSTHASPDDRVLGLELRARIQAAIDALPPRQREVITLRDLEGWSSAEVRDRLHLTEANQRVLLHRARAKVRDSVAN